MKKRKQQDVEEIDINDDLILDLDDDLYLEDNELIDDLMDDVGEIL